MLAGFTASWPDVIPLPANATQMFAGATVLLMATLPLAFPAEVGVKSMVRVRLWPGARLVGNATPVSLKPWPETVIWETRTVAVWAALLESVMEVDFELPTGTPPKFTLDALTDKLPIGARLDGDVAVILVTAHPAVNRMASTRKMVRQHARSCTAPALTWRLGTLIGIASLKVSTER